MIEDVKNILIKLLNKDIKYRKKFLYDWVINNKDYKLYAITYIVNDNQFTIFPDCRQQLSIEIHKNNELIKNIICSDEEIIEIILLLDKLYKASQDKAYYEFKHSLDD